MSERRYDPEIAPLIEHLPLDMDWNDVPGARAGLIELVRKFATSSEDPEGVTYQDRSIPGAAGDPDVAVRVYRPEGAEGLLPGVLYLHGGGFCVGSIEVEHLGAAATARAVGAVLVSVEYRLAPEHPFPAGIEDCYAALVWMGANAAELGIDTQHLAVMGSSAGGGLSAGVALMARDRDGPKLCFQLLNIPELDDRLETRSMQEFTDTPLWNRSNAIMSWRYYLGDASGGDVSPYAAPARAKDLSGLPPAYVATMEYDPLRDEGILYAMRMLEQGVSVELHQFPGTFHGSIVFTNAAVSRRTNEEVLRALQDGLKR